MPIGCRHDRRDRSPYQHAAKRWLVCSRTCARCVAAGTARGGSRAELLRHAARQRRFLWRAHAPLRRATYEIAGDGTAGHAFVRAGDRRACCCPGAIGSRSILPRRSRSIRVRSHSCRMGDQDMWPGPKGEIQYVINVMWPLTDFVLENGGTRLWTGSHLEQSIPTVPKADAVVPAVSTGDALIFRVRRSMAAVAISACHRAAGSSSATAWDGSGLSSSNGWSTHRRSRGISRPNSRLWSAMPSIVPISAMSRADAPISSCATTFLSIVQRSMRCCPSRPRQQRRS